MSATAPGAAPESWASSRAEYDHYAAQYWAMRRKHDGYTEPLRPGQHILHLLLTVLTGGPWAIVWIIRARRGNRIPGDPLAPIPVWPPPGIDAPRG